MVCLTWFTIVFVMPVLIYYSIPVSGSHLAHCDDYMCPTGCDTCTSNKTCCTCSPGRYGQKCEQYCHVNCNTCSSSGRCDTCNDTLVYGPLCDQPCDLCKNGKCDRFRCKNGCQRRLFEKQSQTLPGQPEVYKCEWCPDSCTHCESYNNCTSCISRRWGKHCDKQCTGNCKTCDQRTGECPPTMCGQGRYVDSDGKCKRCPEKCPLCKSETDCIADTTAYTRNKDDDKKPFADDGKKQSEEHEYSANEASSPGPLALESLCSLVSPNILVVLMELTFICSIHFFSKNLQ